jgi:hypothetical protein
LANLRFAARSAAFGIPGGVHCRLLFALRAAGD